MELAAEHAFLQGVAMSQTEIITFEKGINRKKSPLFLTEGELYSCEGLVFDTPGQLDCRPEMTTGETIYTGSDGTVNGLDRYSDSILASVKRYCPGGQAYFNYIYQRSTMGSYSNVGLMAASSRPSFLNYEKFIFAVDGEDRRAYIDEKEYVWGVDNPAFPPILAAGAAGNPDGEYTCYVTFYIEFPNGKAIESGPSAAATVTLSSEKAEWSRIPVCTYQGEELIISRRLYRTVSGVAYLSKIIPDNTTTTYSDDATDTALQLSTILGTTSYTTPPDNMVDITMHLQSVFGVKDNRLYFSEAYAPFSFKTTSDIVISKEDEDITGLISWSDQLYMVTTAQWKRLSGTDPDTWSIKSTFSDVGIINRQTIIETMFGIIGLWYDGIYLFDGSTTKNITEKILGRDFFTSITDWDLAYAEYDGQLYTFYYSSDGTELDSCLTLDFSLYPDFIAYTSDFIPTANFFHSETGTEYFAMDGYEYEVGGSETIATSFQTRDMSFGNISQQKNLEYLYYDIDTGGNDVVISFYVDGSLSSYTLTLNTTSRGRKRSPMLPNLEGYRFSIAMACADSADLVIYAPWSITATLVGN